MLLLGDIGLGLVSSALAVVIRARRKTRRPDQLGDTVEIVLASFGLAVLVVEGLLPGFWMIGRYALYGGALEGSPATRVRRSRVCCVPWPIGLVISTYTAARAYVSLVARRHRR